MLLVIVHKMIYLTHIFHIGHLNKDQLVKGSAENKNTKGRLRKMTEVPEEFGECAWNV